MCAIGTLEFIIDKGSSPYYVWSINGANLFTGSFTLTMFCIGLLHLVCDTSNGGNTERFILRMVTVFICCINLILMNFAGDPLNSIGKPVVHLFVVTMIGMGNAYLDTLGFMYWWQPSSIDRDSAKFSTDYGSTTKVFSILEEDISQEADWEKEEA